MSAPDTVQEQRPVEAMSDRELLEEMATNMRQVRSLVEGFFGDLKSGKLNPMQMMMGMFKG